MISIKVHDEGKVWDVTIEDDHHGELAEGGLLAFEFQTKNDAMAFADRAADLFSSVEPVEITKPLTLSPAARSDSVGEQLPLGH